MRCEHTRLMDDGGHEMEEKLIHANPAPAPTTPPHPIPSHLRVHDMEEEVVAKRRLAYKKRKTRISAGVWEGCV